MATREVVLTMKASLPVWVVINPEDKLHSIWLTEERAQQEAIELNRAIRHREHQGQYYVKREEARV